MEERNKFVLSMLLLAIGMLMSWSILIWNIANGQELTMSAIIWGIGLWLMGVAVRI